MLLLDRFFERQLKKSFSVVLLAIHRQDIVAVASKHPFGRGHENTTANFYFLIAEKCCKFLGMHPDRLVRFIKDGEVKLYACLSCCRSKPVTALIGREYDLGSIGGCAKQRRNLIRVRVRRQSEYHRLRQQIHRAQDCQPIRHCKHKANLGQCREQETRGSNR